MELFIGLMSGTSADGVNAVLVDFSTQPPRLIASQQKNYPAEIRKKVLDLFQPGDNEVHRVGELDALLAHEYVSAIETLLANSTFKPQDINAIGCHGQTIRHWPDHNPPFTVQIGDPSTVAALSGITTVADFRRKDIALGGQGAPLVPAFHRYLFSDGAKDKAIVNIGGIANVTILANSDCVTGYDTGPGNCLLDEWSFLHLQKDYDDQGRWAAEGKISEKLLAALLADSYFRTPPPKSTGREYFKLSWLEHILQTHQLSLSAIDIQRTLTELTAKSIVNAIHHDLQQGEIIICGGGAYNAFLMSRIKQLAGEKFSLSRSEIFAPEWIEAIAFAWLARQTISKKVGNLANVTGACKDTILGGIYYP